VFQRFSFSAFGLDTFQDFLPMAHFSSDDHVRQPLPKYLAISPNSQPMLGNIAIE